MIQIAAAILQIELNKAIVHFGTGAVSGEAALSAVGIVLRISIVVVSICVGIGVGIQPIIGFNQGAGLERRVKETFRKAVSIATVVTDVAGSGKSTLISQVFAKQYKHDIVMVDQGPITATNRSTPASYLGFFDEIRKLLARESGKPDGLFSFNSALACTYKGKNIVELLGLTASQMLEVFDDAKT